MRLRRKCGHCNGRGTVAITGVYADTLALLQRQHRAITGADLAAIAGCQPTAMNNRLAALERMGLASSYRYGRARLYSAKKSR